MSTKPVLIIDGNPVADITEQAVEDKVEVTSISGDTFKSILNRLFGEVDISKITQDSTLVINNEIFTLQSKTSTELIFTLCAIGNDSRQYVRTFILNTTNSHYMYGVINYGAQAMAVADYADELVYATFSLYYNSASIKADFETHANKCMMPDGTTNVAQAIDEGLVDYDSITITQDAGGTVFDSRIASGSTIIATRKGKFVTVVISLLAINLAATNIYDVIDIFTLPLEYRPLQYTLDSAVGAANSYPYSIFINTDGKIQIQPIGQVNKPTTESYVRITKTFVALY